MTQILIACHLHSVTYSLSLTICYIQFDTYHVVYSVSLTILSLSIFDLQAFTYRHLKYQAYSLSLFQYVTYNVSPCIIPFTAIYSVSLAVYRLQYVTHSLSLTLWSYPGNLELCRLTLSTQIQLNIKSLPKFLSL